MQPCPALLPSLPLALWNSPKLELNLEHSMWWTSGKMQMHGDTWRHMTTHDHTWRHMMMIVDDYWRLLMMIGEGRNNHWLMSFEPCLKYTHIYIYSHLGTIIPFLWTLKTIWKRQPSVVFTVRWASVIVILGTWGTKAKYDIMSWCQIPSDSVPFNYLQFRFLASKHMAGNIAFVEEPYQ